MTISLAVFLGLIQGLTEFLPISSSGHLVIFQKLAGLDYPPVAFDVFLHLGTLVATVWVFWEDIRKINLDFGKKLILGLVPTGILGLWIKSLGPGVFNSYTLVGITYLLTSLLLISSRFINSKPQSRPLSFPTSFFVGLAQGIAVLPGISRSGTTIITGLWLGLSRKDAVRFSFLLSIPAILAAQILELDSPVVFSQFSVSSYFLGFLSALISGLFALKFLEYLLKESKLYLFALYTLPLSLILFLLN